MVPALRPGRPVLPIALALVSAGALLGASNAVRNGGFEEGLAAPWGTGQYAEGRSAWWNSGTCQSSAEIVSDVRRSGRSALHLRNPSPRAPHVYGTTQQPLDLAAGRRYRMELWAKGRSLSSNGAVTVAVDAAWGIRPIVIPAGTFDWSRFTGDFTLPALPAQLRIIIEDTGEAWLDDIRVFPVDVPKELEEFGDLVSLPDAPTRATIGRAGGVLALPGGARLEVPSGSFTAEAPVTVQVARLDLASVDARVEAARVYAVTATHEGRLGTPVVLDLGVPAGEVAVSERVGSGWRRHALLPGDTARVAIESFSTHWLATVFRAGSLVSADRMRREERAAAADPEIARLRESERAVKRRERLAAGDVSTREFYGVDQRAQVSQSEMKEELRNVLARHRDGLRPLPADAPSDNQQIFDFLHGITGPSGQPGYYWNAVKDSQSVIRRRLMEQPERLTPGRFLELCIQANGGDLRMGVLAANNFLKDVTMGGRDYPKSRKNEEGRVVMVDVPERFGGPASKLETWRNDDVAPAGYYDKMGPLYHLFSAMTAGVWGGTHFSRAAAVGENFLRVTGWEKDFPDPEKGEADLAGASLARWINAGMPGAEKLTGTAPAPPARPARAPLKGSGTWTVSRPELSGEGPISLILDPIRLTISGEFSGATTRVSEGKSRRVAFAGTIAGSYDPKAGTFKGKVAFDKARTVPAGETAHALSIEGSLEEGVVSGWAYVQSTPEDGFYEAQSRAAVEMRRIEADRSGGPGPDRFDAEAWRRGLEERRKKEAQIFRFRVS